MYQGPFSPEVGYNLVVSYEPFSYIILIYDLVVSQEPFSREVGYHLVVSQEPFSREVGYHLVVSQERFRNSSHSGRVCRFEVCSLQFSSSSCVM
jgi:hypothetical protein